MAALPRVVVPGRNIARSFWRFILICADITNSYLAMNGPFLSAAITYYALFSLIPLTLAIMFIVGTFYHGSDALEARLSLAVNTLMPVSRETVADILEEMANSRAITGMLGILGLLWVSTTVFGAIRKGVNTVWGISEPRRFFHERLIDFTFTAGAGLLMVVPMALTAGVGVLGDFTSALRTGDVEGDRLTGLLLTALSPFISLVVLMLIYRFLPNTPVRFRDIWTGALLTALCFEGWKTVFLWYTGNYPIYDTVYGPVGALVALLTWIYISANILLVGALVTSRYSAHMSHRIVHFGRGLVSLWAPRVQRAISPDTGGAGDND